MIVKTKEKQISFLYQETDPYFDIGYKILEKSEIAEMLPCRRKMQNDKNKLCFYAEGKESVLLQQVLPKPIQTVCIAKFSCNRQDCG